MIEIECYLDGRGLNLYDSCDHVNAWCAGVVGDRVAGGCAWCAGVGGGCGGRTVGGCGRGKVGGMR